MRDYLVQTNRERRGGIDGVHLFFGALLGANLGTLEQLPLLDYVKLIVLLAGTVVGLRMISTSERRLYALLTLGLYVILVGFVLFSPMLRPEGLPEPGITRLGATLGVWVGAVLLVEYWPVKKSGVRHAEPQAAGEADVPPTR